MDFNLEEKNKRHADFWSREHEKNNYQKINKQFDDLWEQSDYEDYDTFMNHYLIDLYNKKDLLSKKEFTNKVLNFSLVHNELIEVALEEPLNKNQYCKYINNIFKLNIKEEFLITSYVDKLPFERYFNVVNYFNEILKNKYSPFIKNKKKWVDDYEQYEDDIRLINEVRYALWDNNPELLNAEYEKCKDDLDPYG